MTGCIYVFCKELITKNNRFSIYLFLFGFVTLLHGPNGISEQYKFLLVNKGLL